jgi:hypothetical protein
VEENIKKEQPACTWIRHRECPHEELIKENSRFLVCDICLKAVTADALAKIHLNLSQGHYVIATK